MKKTFQDPLDPQRDLFRRLCEYLNASTRQENARSSADFFSGGFKFSDEFPADYETMGDQLLPLVDLLRCLWGYRSSLVMGQPRQDLAHYWEAAKVFAPKWAGFASERCSPEMRIQAEQAEHQTSALADELDLLDLELPESSAAENAEHVILSASNQKSVIS